MTDEEDILRVLIKELQRLCKENDILYNQKSPQAEVIKIVRKQGYLKTWYKKRTDEDYDYKYWNKYWKK